MKRAFRVYNIPADSLESRSLENGWTVGKKITRKQTSTGGRFSVGYEVTNKKGYKAFLKAFDFSSSQQEPDPLRSLQSMLEDFNFERDLLQKCKDHKLRRIMIPIEEGKVQIKGFSNLISTVHYLIFELAKGDIRDVMDAFDDFELAFRLRSLHHVAVGLSQLHRIGVAHQDLKPSNILFTNEEVSKIGDLGRSVDKNLSSNNDRRLVLGDQGYAPLELYYDYYNNFNEYEQRFLVDLYLLGSLIFFHFTGVSSVQALRSKLNVELGRVFKEDLPNLQYAFKKTINDLEAEVKKVAGDLTKDIVQIAKELCDPDPTQRGDPKLKQTIVSNHNIERYISKLNLLSQKALLVKR